MQAGNTTFGKTTTTFRQQQWKQKWTDVRYLWKILCGIITGNTNNKLTVFTPLPSSDTADQGRSAIIIPQLESKQHLGVERRSNPQQPGTEEEEEEVDGGASDGDTSAALLQVQSFTTASANLQKSQTYLCFCGKTENVWKWEHVWWKEALPAKLPPTT